MIADLYSRKGPAQLYSGKIPRRDVTSASEVAEHSRKEDSRGTNPDVLDSHFSVEQLIQFNSTRVTEPVSLNSGSQQCQLGYIPYI